MALDTELFSRPILASDFSNIGTHAAGRVRVAREVKASTSPTEVSARRRYSQRDIAAATGASQTMVARYFVDNRDELAADDGEAIGKAGRYKRYSVNQYLTALQQISKVKPVPLRSRAATIVFANYKGGCAKSTTTATFAARRALRGAGRVLVIDMDPQGTLSALFGIQPSIDIGSDDTLLPYFDCEQPTIDYAIKKTRLETLDIIPSASSLSHADITIPTNAARKAYGPLKYFELLNAALEPLRSRYELILIDSPPSLSYLTTLSCYAADGMVIPLQPSLPDYASSATFFEQMGSFFEELDGYQKKPKRYSFMRMLLTRHDGSRPHRDMEHEIRSTYGGLVLGPTMIESNAVKEASNNHLTIYELDPSFVHRDTAARALESADNVGRVLEDLAASVPGADAAIAA